MATIYTIKAAGGAGNIESRHASEDDARSAARALSRDYERQDFVVLADDGFEVREVARFCDGAAK